MPRSLTLPLDEETARDLRVGDEVLFSGRIVTGRGPAHRHLARELDPAVRAVSGGGFVYHCAPVVAQEPGTRRWRVVAAGPSPSIGHEEHEPTVIARYGLRGVVGKGGMGEATLAALREHGAVYLHVVGALATALARRVVAVHGVHRLDEFGLAEAIWELEVAEFPAIVTMDAHGESLHAKLSGDDTARAILERKSF
jgi:fumarate hydratase class I